LYRRRGLGTGADYEQAGGVCPFKPRTCVLRATLLGYSSTEVDISALNGVEKNVELATLVLRERVANPYSIVSSGFPIPGKSKDAWYAAMKAIDAGNMAGAINQLKAAAEATPKFAQAWHTLGILQDNIASFPEAKQAFEKAVEADAKLFAAQVALAGTCNKLKDWACATKAAEDNLKADGKRSYPVVNLYLAAARLGLKDYAGAEAAAGEALRSKIMRAEYALARIAAEKGDAAAAKDHLAKYLQADPNSPDANTLKAYAEALGQPQANALAPEI
jgi:tetratricopeptide (TPR) repeat protein